ncbi:MAG: SGNH/GDSL hydrolase family protein [Bacillota bacterium]|nr:SGNH/GDSL hydrolase family protein [Bacillota bacterium]
MNEKDNYSLVLYGDSITKGIVYDNEKCRYKPIKENFSSIVADKFKGTIYNAGRFGNTIIRGLNKMYIEVLKKTPDIVLIEFGGNDCDYKWDDIAQNPDIDHNPNTDISEFRKSLMVMVDQLKNANIIPILMTLPPLDSSKYFKWVSKGNPLAEKNILHWLGTEDRIYTWQKSYSEMISEVAEKTKTTIIDIRKAFLNYGDYSKLLCKDGIHPNPEGHSLMAKVFLNFIQENYNFLLQN